MGPNPIGLLFEGERYQGRVRTEERPYEDTARWRWSASQGERPWGNPTWHLIVLHICHCWDSSQWQKCREDSPDAVAEVVITEQGWTLTRTPVCLQCLVVSSRRGNVRSGTECFHSFEDNDVVIKERPCEFSCKDTLLWKILFLWILLFSVPKSWKYLHSDWLVGEGLSKCKCISYHSICIHGNTITTKARVTNTILKIHVYDFKIFTFLKQIWHAIIHLYSNVCFIWHSNFSKNKLKPKVFFKLR